MGVILRFYGSSIGKKLLVGVTGLFLCVYLVVHVGGNLLLFWNDGGSAFNAYAEILPSLWFITVIEYVLYAVFLLHILTGFYLWLLNKRSRPQQYLLNRRQENSEFVSRATFLTGSIVFIFLVIHMRSFWYPSRFPQGQTFSMYDAVAGAFQDPVYSGFYVIAMVLLALHLRHGFQSAFQTFGLKNRKYTPLIEVLGGIFWLVIPGLFASMPIYFFSRSCHWFH
jgi:succinate dehydrogenase / fumarate reductase cytochrome b subunit